jgi:hypothetical protein
MEWIGSGGSPASEFDLAPSIWQPHTRAVYWRAWRLVATWGVGRLLVGTGRHPVDVAATLKALTWDLSAPLCRRRTWFASLCRRPESSWFGRRCGLETRAASFIFRCRCVRSTNSRPSPGSSAARLDSEPSRGAQAAHPEGDGALAACVAAGHAGAASRAPWLLMTVVVTLGCLRVNEVAWLQVCDLWFNFLMSYGVPGFDGALAGSGCLRGGRARRRRISMASDVASQGGGAGPGRDRSRRAC